MLQDHVPQLLQLRVTQHQGDCRRLCGRCSGELRPQLWSGRIESTVVRVFAELRPQVRHKPQPDLVVAQIVAQSPESAFIGWYFVGTVNDYIGTKTSKKAIQ